MTKTEASKDDELEPSKTNGSESNAPEAENKPDESETDEAIDDIVRSEGDDELKAQDTAAKPVVMQVGWWGRFKNLQAHWWGDPRKRWGTIIAIVIVIGVLAALPLTRYDILGLLIREKVTVEAVDSKNGTPVSGAQVELAGVWAETDAQGRAIMRVRTGSDHLQVGKTYYAGSKQTVLVTLSPNHNMFKAKLVALGRQVKVKLVDTISAKPVAGAKLTAGGAGTKTSTGGQATVVLPSGATVQTANVSLQGYNPTKVTIEANGTVAKNTFKLTPAGKLYFLSNLSGTIDVVKTNLDGTDRQTVLAGTGTEDPHSTSLLASRDWKYLALLSKRSGSNASLYLIDITDGDKLTTIDQGNATFTPVGWSGDRFIYQVDRSATVSDWQSGQEALKSFNPATGNTLLLDQTQASGTSQSDWLRQSFGSEYLMGSQVVYSKGWDASFADFSQLLTKQAELDAIGPDGSSARTLKTFSVAGGTQTSYLAVGTQLYAPDGLYVDWGLGGGSDQFYTYNGSTITQDNSITPDTYNNADYATYLLSPSGNSTFWADQRDGKNTLFTGDDNASGQKQIASLSDYSPYGWFTDKYLLVSKNSSELYIMPLTGGTPLKVTDYYKPPINYNGYGGGYGGL